MDPIAIEAKSRHRQPKSYSDRDDLTAFQIELEGNPYAHALSGGVRKCAYTGVRLPVHFLQRFVAEFSTRGERIAASIVHRDSSVGHVVQSEDATSHSPSSAYILNSQALMRQLSVKNRWAALVTERMKRNFDARAVGGKADPSRKWAKQWKHDSNLPEVVLSSLRQAVVRAVHGLVALPGGGRYITLVGGLSESENLCRRNSSGTTTAPTIVYNLHTLLKNEEREAVLVKLDKIGAEVDTVAIEAQPQTVELQLALQTLSAFLGNGRDP